MNKKIRILFILIVILLLGIGISNAFDLNEKLKNNFKLNLAEKLKDKDLNVSLSIEDDLKSSLSHLISNKIKNKNGNTEVEITKDKILKFKDLKNSKIELKKLNYKNLEGYELDKLKLKNKKILLDIKSNKSVFLRQDNSSGNNSKWKKYRGKGEINFENYTAFAENDLPLDIIDSKDNYVDANVTVGEETDIDFKLNYVKKLKLKNLKKGEIGVEEINKKEIFAINPEKLDFEEGILTFRATRNTLLKCKDWNFENQSCPPAKRTCIGEGRDQVCEIEGGWVKLMTGLIPGKLYNITINATDPAFAQYDAGYGAPACLTGESPCIAGNSLLQSRDSLGTAEPNQPNTIDTCTDGTSGSYQTDESVDNITITSLNGSYFRQGDTVNVKARIYCYSTNTGDNINFAHTNSISSISWSVKDFVDPCPSAGYNYVTGTFTLGNNVGLQAIRTIIQWNGNTATTCGGGNYDDNDDVVFQVYSRNPPLVTNVKPAENTTYNISDNVTITAQIISDNTLNSVKANITLPNGTVKQINLSPKKIGEVQSNIIINGSWKTINFDNNYENPVVFASPLTVNDNVPAEVRIRNVQSNSCEIRAQEPTGDYPENDDHGNEVISLWVMEEGIHKLQNGEFIEVHNTLSTTTASGTGPDSWTTYNYNLSYVSPPVVLSQVQTNNDPRFVTTTKRNVGASSFQMSMEVAQDNASAHGNEYIGWLAINATGASLSSVIDGIKYSSVISSDSIRGHDNGCYAAAHGLGTVPVAVVGMQNKRDGGNGGWPRYCNNDNTWTSTNTYWEIDEVDNGERSHTAEEVSFIAFNTTGSITDPRVWSGVYNIVKGGRHNVTIIAKDVPGNINDSEDTYFFVPLPAVNVIPDSTLIGKEYLINETAIIKANITASSPILISYVNIILPNGSSVQINLTNLGNVYQSNFTNLIQRGRYNITFYAQDSLGGISNDKTSYFIRKAPPAKFIDVIDVNDNYVPYTVGIISNTSGILDLEINISNNAVKKIIVDNHDFDSFKSIIRIENSTNDSDYESNYLIDFSEFNLSEANVTVNATGYHLLKCVDVNLTTLTCNDENFTMFKSGLVKGELYTFILNATDPIFTETVQGDNDTIDSYIRQGAANTNYGGLNNIRIGKGGATNPLRGILQFNISDIPTGATITSANLSLYFYSIRNGDDQGNRTYGVHRVDTNRPWEELQVTWNNYNSSNTWTSGGGDFNSTATDTVTFDNTSLNSWITFDVTSDLIYFLNNSNTYFGWIIKDDNETTTRTRRDFRSSEYTGNVLLRPKLEIEYNIKPVIEQVILNSTLGTNLTSENLTRYIINLTDGNNDSVKNITQWFLDGQSFQNLMMPFEANGNENTFTRDYVNDNVNITINGATWNRTGGYDGFGAYEYGSDGDYILNNITCDGATAITVAVWVKSDVTNTDNGIWIARQPDGTDSVCGVRYDAGGAFGGGTNLIKAGITINNGSGNNTIQIESSNNTQTTGWQFLVLTWESGDVLRLYINGVEDTNPTYLDSAVTGVLSGTTGLRIGIGAKDTGSTGWDGYIDDFTVYKRKLSDEQILALYNRTDLIVSQETKAGDKWQACVTPNDGFEDGTRICSNNLTINNRIPSIQQVILNSTNATNTSSENLTRFVINATDLDGDNIKNITNWYVNEKSYTLMNMPFETWDESNKTKDYSEYQNGTIINNVFWNQTGGYDNFGAYHFNESGYIRITENDRYDIFEDTNKTFMFWFKRDETESQSLFSKSSSSLGSNGFGWDIRLSVTGSPVFFFNNGSGSISSMPSGITTQVGSWNHIAVTIDRGNEFARFYINGTEVANKSLDRLGSWDNAFNVNIGGRGEGTALFNGTIDEVYMFNRTLSSEQIKTFYNRTDLIVSQETKAGDKWQACVTPNDNYQDGEEVCSNNLTIGGIKKYTSIFAAQSSITEFSSASKNYSERIKIVFNATTNGTYGLFSSFDLIKKSNNGTKDDVFAKVLIDGNKISEEKIRSLIIVNHSKEAGIIPDLFNVSIGIHNLTIEFKIENGSFDAKNIDINLVEMVSAHGNPIRSQKTTANYVHTKSGTTYYPEFNWTINKINGVSSTFITTKGVHSVTPGIRAISYNFQDLTNSEVSPTWESIEQQAGIGISMSGIWIFDDQQGNVNMSIGSRNYQAGQTTTVNMSIVDFDMKDSAVNYVNSFAVTNPNTNESNEIQINDTWYKLLSENITLQNGTGLFIASMQTFQLISGDTNTQDVIHVVNITGENCSSIKTRTLTGTLDAANGFNYFICTNLTVGNTYEVNIWTKAAPNGSFNHYDESLTAFEINPFNINVTTSKPPKVYPNQTLEGAKYLLNETAIIRANVTSKFPIDFVWAIITLPNGTEKTINLTNISGTVNDAVYGANFTDLILRGRYNISFYANNSVGLINDTETSYFIRKGYKIIDIVDKGFEFYSYNVSTISNTSGLLNLYANLSYDMVSKMSITLHPEDSFYSIIRVDDRLNENNNSFVDTVAIDLDGINLSDNNITIKTKEGVHLHKCTNFSWALLNCADEFEYEYLYDVDANSTYNIVLNKTDPVFSTTLEGNKTINDSTLRENRANTNYGTIATMRVGRAFTAGSDFNPIIRFNLTGIPENAIINSARLELYFYNIPSVLDSTGNRAYNVYKVQQNPARPWTELGTTWNNYDGVNAWTAGGGDFVATPTDTIVFNSTALNSFVSWNVTADVRNFSLNRSLNFGWIIADNQSTALTRRDFRTKETINVSQRPRLIINFTVLDTDLIPLNISFSHNNPNENENITIFSTILNNGSINATNVTVQFFDGNFTNGTQINGNITIPNLGPGKNVTLNITWISALVGPHNVQVVVDPPILTNGFISELNETNNVLNQSINVKAYNIYYGDIDGNVTLDTSLNETEFNWISNYGGNIYFTDSDETIDFTALQALGRNVTNGLANNDFADADTNLNMTGFNDSIQIIWAVNSTSPKQVTNFTVNSVVIQNVPYVNSTNNSNFITGILWDKTKDTNGEYDIGDKEVLVFISNVNYNKQGIFGIYDYESKVPVLLRDYNLTSSNVKYYIELK